MKYLKAIRLVKIAYNKKERRKKDFIIKKYFDSN